MLRHTNLWCPEDILNKIQNKKQKAVEKLEDACSRADSKQKRSPPVQEQTTLQAQQSREKKLRFYSLT